MTAALVPVRLPRCPHCGKATLPLVTVQPALVRHGGYGADQRRRYEGCPHCGSVRLVETIEVRPS